MKTYKEIKKHLGQKQRIPNTVYVITVSQAGRGSRKFFNYFVARPNKFRKGEIIPKTYKEKVVEIL